MYDPRISSAMLVGILNWATPSSSAMLYSLDVEIAHVERVLFDEQAPRLDRVAHQGGEQVLGDLVVLEPHREQGAGGGVHGRLPQLLGIHLAEALVALDGEAPLALGLEVLDQLLPGLQDALLGRLVGAV